MSYAFMEKSAGMLKSIKIEVEFFVFSCSSCCYRFGSTFTSFSSFFSHGGWAYFYQHLTSPQQPVAADCPHSPKYISLVVLCFHLWTRKYENTKQNSKIPLKQSIKQWNFALWNSRMKFSLYFVARSQLLLLVGDLVFTQSRSK